MLGCAAAGLLPITAIVCVCQGALACNATMRSTFQKFSGMLPNGAMSSFNEPDLLDDLLDHWTSAEHVAEKNMLIRRLQVRHGCPDDAMQLPW